MLIWLQLLDKLVHLVVVLLFLLPLSLPLLSAALTFTVTRGDFTVTRPIRQHVHQVFFAAVFDLLPLRGCFLHPVIAFCVLSLLLLLLRLLALLVCYSLLVRTLAIESLLPPRIAIA